jgi:hypothetical protein
VVIAGHTHLARVLGRRTLGNALYINTGTWAWLMKLDPAQLESAEKFRPVFEQLTAASRIEDLDGNLKFVRPTVALVTKDQPPALLQVQSTITGVTLIPVENNK